MDLDGAWATRQLRWTRADPPARASEDPARRATYVAALQQFEELLDAARATGPASRPLPLFYALSQAGKAIVAAHGEEPQTFGHGLREARPDDPALPLLHRAVRRQRDKHGRDTFGAVTRAIRSGDFEGAIQLGALWVANPDAPRLPLEHWLPEWRLALFVDDTFRLPAGTTLEPGERVIRVLPFSDPAEATADHGGEIASGRYPTVPRGAATAYERVSHGDHQTWFSLIKWDEAATPLDDVAPTAGYASTRHLLPLLPGQRELLSPLMLWWVLLFGFSIYARYNPELWVRSLEVDRASEAVGIEQLLDQAIDRVPVLVYEAILGKFYPVPTAAPGA